MRSFDWVELTWTLLTFAALVVHAVVLSDAWGDIRLMRELGHKGRRWIVAKAIVRRESIRTTVQLLLCAVGVIALVTPPKATENPRSVVFVGIFLTVSFLLLVNSVMDFRERMRLRTYGDRGEGNG